MPVDRVGKRELFTRALSIIRGAGVTDDHPPRSKADTARVARHVYDQMMHVPGMTHAEALNATRRARTAFELGMRMTTAPPQRVPGAGASPAEKEGIAQGNRAGFPVAHEYGPVDIMDRRGGRYEYRVIVEAKGNGREVDTLIVIQSRNRLTAEQVEERALRTFISGEWNEFDYRKKVADLGDDYKVQTYIVSAARDVS